MSAAEGGRPDIVAADQAEPGEPLLVGQRDAVALRSPMRSSPQRGSEPCRRAGSIRASAGDIAAGRVNCGYRVPGGGSSGAPREACHAQVPDRSDQAVALRRRRLCHPVAALDDPLEQPGQRARAVRRMRADAQALGPDVAIEIEAYDECNTIIDVEGAASRIKAAGGGFVGLVGVQSNQFPRAARPDAAVPRRRRAGGDRRLPCLRLPIDAAGASGRYQGGARRSASILYRRRGRRADGRAASRHRRRRAKAGLQLPARHARHGGGDVPDPAARGRDARRRPLHELRRRARLPVPVLVLHHHQRAGPQVALPHAGRCRGDRARQRRAGGHALLRHRRQFRPQQELGADPRPADRTARERGLQDPPAAAGRHALPPHPRLHREGGARRLQHGLHRAREHQSRVADGHQEAAEQDLGISRDAAGLEAPTR